MPTCSLKTFLYVRLTPSVLAHPTSSTTRWPRSPHFQIRNCLVKEDEDSKNTGLCARRRGIEWWGEKALMARRRLGLVRCGCRPTVDECGACDRQAAGSTATMTRYRNRNRNRNRWRCVGQMGSFTTIRHSQRRRTWLGRPSQTHVFEDARHDATRHHQRLGVLVRGGRAPHLSILLDGTVERESIESGGQWLILVAPLSPTATSGSCNRIVARPAWGPSGNDSSTLWALWCPSHPARNKHAAITIR
jgi:hypothetical protein